MLLDVEECEDTRAEEKQVTKEDNENQGRYIFLLLGMSALSSLYQ